MLRRTIIIGLVVGALAVVGLASPASAAAGDKTQVFDFATAEPISGAYSALVRGEDRIGSRIRTWAVAGDAYTLWYVIFNAPQECSDGACGGDDIFNSDGSFNVDQIEAARISVLWGNAGAVAKPSGRLSLGGSLSVGEVPDEPNQVVIGRGEDGALVPLGVVTGLEDSQAAEVHVVIQSHGAAHEDPELLHEQLTTFGGACNPACGDFQFAVHLP
jgi:hypothetical protein